MIVLLCVLLAAQAATCASLAVYIRQARASRAELATKLDALQGRADRPIVLEPRRVI